MPRAVGIDKFAFRQSRFGLISLTILLVAFLPAFLLAIRSDQNCFATPPPTWPSRFEHLCGLAMFFSGPAGIAALFIDARKSFAIACCGLWLPLVGLLALAMGCN